MRPGFAIVILLAVVGIPTLVFTAVMSLVLGPFALLIPAGVIWLVGHKLNAARRREIARRGSTGWY